MKNVSFWGWEMPKRDLGIGGLGDLGDLKIWGFENLKMGVG